MAIYGEQFLNPETQQPVIESGWASRLLNVLKRQAANHKIVDFEGGDTHTSHGVTEVVNRQPLRGSLYDDQVHLEVNGHRLLGDSHIGYAVNVYVPEKVKHTGVV